MSKQKINMDKDRKCHLNKFEKSIYYKYKDLRLLDIAFTHSSYSNEHHENPRDNERLEFLGDSVINLIITDLIFKNNFNLQEGDLTRLRANLICEDSFAKLSEYIDIPSYLLLGKGEENNGGRHRKSLMADAFEAFVGSLYMDSDFSNTQRVLLRAFRDLEAFYISKKTNKDYKTLFQEEIQKHSKEKIKYNLFKEEGPDHNKVFYFNLTVGGKEKGRGKGKSKKEAEQKAAFDALKKMSLIDEKD